MQRTIENGCKQLVKVCADLQAHERALIISDPTTSDVGEKLTEAALSVSANSVHRVTPVAEIHGQEPTAEIAELMQNADVIFGITKMSMAHTHARHAATSKGARYLSLPDYTFELLKRPALFVDFRKITEFSDSLAEKFTNGKKIKVTSALGTDLTLNITDRRGNSAPGWCYAKGVLASPPDAEANVPPVEDDTEGTLVVDGSIPCRELGLLAAPITLKIQKGKIIEIMGKDADVLNRVFNRFNTDATRVAAEFGIGLNPAAELIGSMLEDEGCLSTIHVGFGSNITIGGRNKVPFHLDTIVRNATVYIDDELLIESGVIRHYMFDEIML